MESYAYIDGHYDEAEKLYKDMKIKDALIMLLYECGEKSIEKIEVKILIGKCYFRCV